MRSAAQRALMFALSGGQLALSSAQYFQRRYDANGQFDSEQGIGIESSQSNGHVVFGWTYSPFDTLPYIAIYAMSIEPDGNPMDTNYATLPQKSCRPGWYNTSYLRDGAQLGVAGCTQDGTTTRPALFLFDSLGRVDTIIEYGTTGEHWLERGCRQTPDGGYILCGETNVSGTSIDAFVLKIDNTYSQQWIQTYGLSNRNEYLVTVDLLPGGGYYLGGQVLSTLTQRDNWVLGLDSTGGVLWEHTYGGNYDDPLAQVQTLADSNMVFATALSSSGGWVGRSRLVKLDPSGNMIWSHLYGATVAGPFLLAVKEVTPNGDLVACGTTSHLPGYINGVLLRTTALGDSLWLRHYHYYDSLWTEGKGELYDVVPTLDNGFVAVGYAYGSSNNPADYALATYSQDTWVIKVDSMGCLVPGCDGISTITTQITNYRDALRVAPNPASTSAQLRWQLPQALTSKGAAVLTIVDAQSRVVRTEALGLPSGTHELDVSALAPGLYHLHVVQAGTWITGCKLVVE